MNEIDRGQWDEIQTEFGQGAEPLGSPRVQLTESGLQVEFGDGESDVSVWATDKSTRIDTGALTLLVSRERRLLLRRLEPYPIRRWEVLYDSDAPVQSTQTQSSELVQQLMITLREGLGLYYEGQVDETDPAVPLVKILLNKLLDADRRHDRPDLTEHAVKIVRTVRSLVPRR